MILALFLPWVPITLSVAIAARLMPRRRAALLGMCCALFWIVLARAGLGSKLWLDGWLLAALLSGAAAMVGMAFWASEESGWPPNWTGHAHADSVQGSRFRAGGPVVSPVASPHVGGEIRPRGKAAKGGAPALAAVAETVVAFDDWLDRHRNDPDPWPVFDEFIRSVLHQHCGAAHVRPFRLLSEGDLLLPLREIRPATDAAGISARQGIIGHVITSGQTYFSGDPVLGELIHTLADGSEASLGRIEWCFAIRNGGRRIGAVAVGQLGAASRAQRTHLEVMEGLINLFWTTLSEACRSRVATQIDPITGLLVRESFLRAAEDAVEESYREHEPVALAAFAIEGLRSLDDAGLWEVSNELVRGLGHLIQCKVRGDDRLGRFDDARFLLLLRRVDSELAGLIVHQLLGKLDAFCRDSLRLGADITVRCGLAGSGTEMPPLPELVARALTLAHEARTRCVPMVSDLAEGSRRGGFTVPATAGRPGSGFTVQDPGSGIAVSEPRASASAQSEPRA